MIFEHTSYRTFLKSVLADRVSRNPSYSLRAMAKGCGIQPSHLSAINNGVKNLSPDTALKIAARLDLTDTEAEYFCLLVQYENAKTPELKETFQRRLRALSPQNEVRDLSIDAFKMIADWYHIPILEMTTLQKFEFTPANIAKRLGITPLEAQVAIERLERLELLERNSKGRYQKVHTDAVFRSEHRNLALRRFHKQMLERAIASLETQTPQEKYVGSQTFSIAADDLEGARAIIEDFRKRMVAHFAKAKHKTQTYHLGVQLFNLTKENEK